jgi:hypothetical protein
MARSARRFAERAVGLLREHLADISARINAHRDRDGLIAVDVHVGDITTTLQIADHEHLGRLRTQSIAFDVDTESGRHSVRARVLTIRPRLPTLSNVEVVEPRWRQQITPLAIEPGTAVEALAVIREAVAQLSSPLPRPGPSTTC